jgi:hypothetical protein
VRHAQLTLVFLSKKSISGKILAEENLGILAIQTVWWWWHYSRLFCVMETLSYHDLSQ